MKYTLRFTDGGTIEIEAETTADAVADAETELLDECPDSRSVRAHGILECPDGEEIPLAVVSDPVEPECPHEDGHAWGRAVTYGHGGGVISVRECRLCGLKHFTDTYPTDPETGEQGGWTEESYRASERRA